MSSSSIPNPATLSLEDKPALAHDSMSSLSIAVSDVSRENSMVISPSEQGNAPTSALDALAAAACIAESTHNNISDSNTDKTPYEDDPGKSIITRIQMTDVLCGRGGKTNHHPGNVFFRRLVRLKQQTYLKASKREKAGVAREIVQLVRLQNGRFLKQVGEKKWMDIGNRKAREKTSQALREGAPELREELQQTVPSGTTSNTTTSIVKAPSGEEEPTTTPATVLVEKPASVLAANRARIVSDDSVLGLRPLFHSVEPCEEPRPPVLYQPNHAHFIVETSSAGSKRKLTESFSTDSESSSASSSSCSLQEPQWMQESSPNKRAGPRLKYFKTRVTDPPCV